VSLFLLYRVEQPVEIGDVRRVRAHPDDVLADFFDGLVQHFLTVARDEDISAFLDKTLGRRQCHAGSSSGNHGDFIL
jgi:hypothetical protein